MEKEIIESNGKKVSFITLGCKVNQYDSDAMRSLFVRNGYKMAKENENADVYVINTCSVTSIGDRKSRQMVRRIRREHPGLLLRQQGVMRSWRPMFLYKWVMLMSLWESRIDPILWNM